jgi:hypothetical protein
MGVVAVNGLRMVIGLVLVGSVVVETVMVPLLAHDLEEDVNADMADVRVPVLVIVLLAITAVQVCAVCVWRLLVLVRRGQVFSDAAFRWVDVIIATIAASALLPVAMGVVLAPGEAVAPGVVLLLGGLAVLVAGVALIVLVQRALLAQAVARDVEARGLQGELDQVI